MSIRVRIFISLARPTMKYPSYAKQMMYPKILLNEMMDGGDSSDAGYDVV
jgi:hypothetical protein